MWSGAFSTRFRWLLCLPASKTTNEEVCCNIIEVDASLATQHFLSPLCHVLVCRSEQLVLSTHLVFQTRRNLKSLLLNAWENKSDAFTSKLDSLYRLVLTALIVQSSFSADHTIVVTLFPAREQVHLDTNVL